MDNKNDNFKKIIEHLKRKKAKLNKKTGKESKPVIEINGNDLFCWHGYSYLYIHYDDEKVWNPYKISIEKQAVFARKQEIGISCYEDVAPTQEDVIECIRYRL